MNLSSHPKQESLSHHRRTARLRTLRGVAAGAVTACAACLYTPAAVANNGIMLETISDYTYTSGGSTINNTDCNTEGSGFWTPMTATGTLWTGTNWYRDNGVYDTDFYDPEISGNSYDNDTDNFDPAGASIAWVFAHGSCNDATNNSCVEDSACGSGYCPNFPLTGLNQAACVNHLPRVILTSSTVFRHGNAVTYGDGFIGMAFGEDSSSGNWDGAGLNGSINVAMITNSCPIRAPWLFGTQSHMHGGVHMVMMQMPVGNIANTSGSQPITSDTYQWSARGSTVANIILANVNAPISSAWLAPSVVSPAYSGAGANLVTAFADNASGAHTRISDETWAQSLDESRDAKSGAAGYAVWACNFSNCSSYSL